MFGWLKSCTCCCGSIGALCSMSTMIGLSSWILTSTGGRAAGSCATPATAMASAARLVAMAGSRRYACGGRRECECTGMTRILARGVEGEPVWRGGRSSSLNARLRDCPINSADSLRTTRMNAENLTRVSPHIKKRGILLTRPAAPLEWS